MPRNAHLTVQQWGNSLAVRIPAAVARSMRFSVGQPVELSVEDDRLVVRPAGTPRPSLEQRLGAFDPQRHGGEAMSAPRVGAEAR